MTGESTGRASDRREEAAGGRADAGRGLPAPSTVPGPEHGPAGTAPQREESERFPAVAGYQILRELGRGGMGAVYEARDLRLGRLVALKVVRTTAIDADELARFMAEARALAALRHPNVVSIHAVSEPSQPPFFTMEWMGGGSLAQRLDGAPWPCRKAAELIEILARALHFVHLHHLVHRDLKPANILLTAEGLPKIADFGLAKQLGGDRSLFASDAIVGTPPYMAPEQALGSLAGEVGPAADIYGLGAILYELLTGRPPFRAATAADAILQVLRAEPAPPRRLNSRVPRNLEAVCLKCLQKKPRRRFADALKLAEDLRNFLDGKPLVWARAVGRVERALLWALRRPTRAAVYGLTALVLLLMALVAVANWTGSREIDAAGDRLAGRVKESDRAMARLVANVVEKNLHDRIDFLEEFRKDHPEAVGEIRDGRKAELAGLLGQLCAQGASRKLFSQYAIADGRGFVLAGCPEPGDRDKKRAYRDWFSGDGDQYGRELQSFAPVRATHISDPYVPGAGDRPALSINVTVPLSDGTGGDPVGVLTARLEVRALHSWLEGVDLRDGFVVLLNERGHCLLHEREAAIDLGAGESPVDWRASCPLYRQALGDDAQDRADSYEDPIDKKEYLVGYAPFRRLAGGGAPVHWVALVQHERGAVLLPMEELQAARWTRVVLELAIGAVALGGLWTWLAFTRRQEKAAPTG